MASTAPSDASLPVRLTSIRYAAQDSLLFEFTTLAGALPPVAAGAHLDLHMPIGVRPYSLITPLCSAQRYVVAVKHEPMGRGGSQWLHQQVRVGQTLQIGYPRNNFVLDEDAEATLLLAGGIGITPLYGMFVRLQELGRPVRLHYWCRSVDHALFVDHLADHEDATLHFSSGLKRESVGTVLQTAEPNTAIYCCGPARMLEDCIADVPDASRLRIERFVAAPATGDDLGGFTVRLAGTGQEIAVPAGETILNALIAAGIDVPYSCEEGVCGACETRLLEGVPLHRDTVRSAEDHTRLRTVMICCAGSQGPRLVLDL